MARIVAGAALAAAGIAGCSDALQRVAGPDSAAGGETGVHAATTGAYSTVIGEDWKSYATKDQLKQAQLFWWVDAAGRDVYNYVDLVQDPTFGQVARITFPANTGDSGSSPRISKPFPTVLDKVWYRWRVKFAPGWTTAGPDPSGWANSYKLAFMDWKNFNGRNEIEYSNTSEYITGTAVQDGTTGTWLNYNETLLSGSAANFGVTSSEWTDGEWYEFVMYYEKTGATSARSSYWRRRLTNGGTVANNAWTFHGVSLSGNTTPQVEGIELGVNKNKNNPTTMYLYWGPWEVVDGAQYANPFSMPNVTGSTTTPPPAATVTSVQVTPGTATVAPGATAQFSAVQVMSDGTQQPASVAWTATGGTVSTAGLYTAGSTAGTFQVIGKASNGMADTSAVTISASAATLTKVAVAPKSGTLQAGGTLQYAATGTYSDGTSKAVTPTWTATGGTITAAGLYTAGATAGTFRVIGTSGALADTATVTIAAATATVTKVVLSPKTPSVATGGTVQFSTTATYSDGTSKAVTPTYSSLGGSISASGLYTAGQTAGTFSVKATVSGVADSTTVTVTAPAAVTVTRLTLSPKASSVQGGSTLQYATTATYSDGTTKTVTPSYTSLGGSISASGTYTAGQTAGTYPVKATMSGVADSTTVTITATTTTPPPTTSSYSRAAGDDWRGYSSTSALASAGYFSWNSSASVYNNVALVSDPTFGQAVRVTQSAGTTVAPSLNKALPSALGKMWFRWRVKFTPGWTTLGTGTAPAEWNMGRWTWSGYGGSGALGFQNGREYATDWSAKNSSNQYIQYSENILPGSTAFGTTSTEWTDGQWYEYVVYWEKTGATTARQHFWKRRLTTGGAVVNNAFTYYGYTEDGNAAPSASAVHLGGDLSRAPAATQYVTWGPWEVVDGAATRNPFGMNGF